MTGREMVIAIVAAGLVGGAAGAAASVASRPEPVEPQIPAAVLERLKSAEDELTRTRTALEDSRKTVTELTERVTTGELKAARLAAEAASQPVVAAGIKPLRVGRRVRGESKGEAEHADVENALSGIDLGEAGGQIAVELGKAIEGLDGSIDLGALGQEQFGAFRDSLALRKLPEAERWNKAKDDLGLSWNQVEDLKKAVADRDAAMKGAMTTETKTGPKGGTITIQRPDAAKAAHAQADYHDRVNSTLNESQRKGWNDKGYENSFGSHPFGGGAMAITLGVQTDIDNGDEKAPK